MQGAFESANSPTLGVAQPLLEPLSPGAESGIPPFASPLHVGEPNIGDRTRFLARLNDILDRRWLTNQGPYVSELEHRLARLFGVKHCVATSNGTVALEIAARATGMAGEVIVPSFTFIATAHALRWQGITPVFCDVDPDTHNVDPTSVEAKITSRTTGILGVHLWGRPCAVDKLADIAAEHELALVFDAAHAFGCSAGGRMVGNFGDAEVFSFHATKVFHTLEGGAIVTNDDEVAERALLMTKFGFAGPDEVVSLGTNAKMNEVSGAMGLTVLEDIDRFIAANRANYREYRNGLAGIPGISLVEYDETERSNYHYVALEVESEESGVTRDELVDRLWMNNVRARRYFHPGCHRSEPYVSDSRYAGDELPITERLADRVLALPNGTAVKTADVRTICALVRATIARSARARGLSPRPVAVEA